MCVSGKGLEDAACVACPPAAQRGRVGCFTRAGRTTRDVHVDTLRLPCRGSVCV